jgi:hypothetical protein
MKLYTTRSMIRTVLKRWRHQYPKGSEARFLAVEDKLAALDVETVTANEIERIIGNDSWTDIHCDECDTYVPAAMELGQEPGYQSNTAMVCLPCLRKAVLELAAASRPQRERGRR